MDRSRSGPGGSGSHFFSASSNGRPLSFVERYLDSAPWVYDRYQSGGIEGERAPLLGESSSRSDGTYLDHRQPLRTLRSIRPRSTVRTSMLFSRHLLSPAPLLLIRPGLEVDGWPNAILAVIVVNFLATYLMTHARPGPSFIWTNMEILGVFGELGKAAMFIALASTHVSDLIELALDPHRERDRSVPDFSSTTQAPHSEPGLIARLRAFVTPGYAHAALLGILLIPAVLSRHRRWVRCGEVLGDIGLVIVLLGTGVMLYLHPPSTGITFVCFSSLIPMVTLVLSQLPHVPALVSRMLYPTHAARALQLPLAGISTLLLLLAISLPTTENVPERRPEQYPLPHTFTSLDLLPDPIGPVFKVVLSVALVLRAPFHCAQAVEWIEQRYLPGRTNKFGVVPSTPLKLVRLLGLGLSTALAAWYVNDVSWLATLAGTVTSLPAMLLVPLLVWPRVPSNGCLYGFLVVLVFVGTVGLCTMNLCLTCLLG